MKLTAPIFALKRRAKLAARKQDIPLHAALDDIARREGFNSWSHLASQLPAVRPSMRLLEQFVPGEMTLLAARPGQGKTLLGLEIAASAARRGRNGFFFTLEYTEADVSRRLKALGIDHADAPVVDTSDMICADHIITRLAKEKSGVVAVIDYLQLLDRKHTNRDLDAQLSMLRDFAAATGAIIVVISQIDRSFELTGKPLPDRFDLRLPNPVSLSPFANACFLHRGKMSLQRLA